MSQKLTTIIVSWNTRDYLQKCLESVSNNFPAELNRTIVIDNASSDGSAEMVRTMFPSVELAENSENIGFARACNQGMASTDSEIILLLNSDCEVNDPKLFDVVLEEFKQSNDVGIIGPIILYPNGDLQSAGQEFTSIKKVFKQQILFRSSPLFAKSVKLPEKPFEPDYVSGSCLFVRKELLSEIGLFDESLIMYAEDMDLCLRAQKAGKKVLLIPEISVHHHKSKSTNKNLSRALQLSVRNNCKFIEKTSGRLAAIIVYLFYATGTFLRVIISIFRKDTSPKAWLALLVRLPKLFLELFINDENNSKL